MFSSRLVRHHIKITCPIWARFPFNSWRLQNRLNYSIPVRCGESIKCGVVLRITRRVPCVNLNDSITVVLFCEERGHEALPAAVQSGNRAILVPFISLRLLCVCVCVCVRWIRAYLRVYLDSSRLAHHLTCLFERVHDVNPVDGSD